MKLQLALNVADLDRAIDYYSRLFDVTPHKIRSGYANFEVTEPPLKLVLFENASADGRINHLGVEVREQKDLDKAIARLKAENLVDKTENATTCCHATQSKVWSQEPEGLRWEWYRITNDAPENAHQPANQATDCCNTG